MEHSLNKTLAIKKGIILYLEPSGEHLDKANKISDAHWCDDYICVGHPLSPWVYNSLRRRLEGKAKAICFYGILSLFTAVCNGKLH